MPNFMNAPEALLGRNDSKNPSTTCKGITSSGRPCRRALAASPKSSPFGGKRRSDALNGVVAIVQEDGQDTEADFYCWQHKDQAQERMDEQHHAPPGRRTMRRSTELFPLKERSSIDTMVQRLGLDTVSEDGRKAKKKTKNPRPPKATETQDYALRPGFAEPTAHVTSGHQQPPGRKPKKKSGFWSSLCCIAEQDDDYEIVRRKKRVSQPSQRPEMSTMAPTPPRIPSRPTEPRRPSSASAPPRKPVPPSPATPPSQSRRQSNAQTGQLMSYIPQHLSPQTTSALLAELIKPISPHDDDGYIYIFWLTPQSKEAPAESTARSLLVPDRPRHDRRISDVMTEYSFDGTNDRDRGKKNGKKTIMLKIGRANNVTRRMNEWQRQCGYALNLVRYYPYHSSSPHPSPSRPTSSLYGDLSRPPAGRRQSSQGEAVKKVPCVKRVERLIHLELHEQQVKRQCAACGKEHREWFEVEASQAGVKAVDECVRRWCSWAETQGTM